MLNVALKKIQFGYNLADFSVFLAEVDQLCLTCLPLLQQATGNANYAKLLLLKISNLLVMKYQFLHGHEHLLGRPFGLLVDPSNSCPLRCPGCLHNSYFRQHDTIIDWPDGLLSLETFERFLRQFAPYALHIDFFNWGEPLANPNTPKFIEMAKGFGLETVLSSNLNTKFDAEKLVCSGLDYLIMSVDGASPEAYQKYRRGGDFARVIGNIEKLVAAKRKFGTQSPRLVWQFLTFEHNVDEIPLATEMAKALGVDVIRFNEPYDVSWGDPALLVNNQHLGKIVLSEYTTDRCNVETTIQSITSNASLIEETYCRTWQGRMGENDQQHATKVGNRCPWLYKNLVMDAHGRILPCCYAPEKSDQYDYVFSTIEQTMGQDPFNTDCFVKARNIRIDKQTVGEPDHAEKRPYCVICKNRKVANIDTDQIINYFNKYNLVSDQPVLSEKSIWLLADWAPLG